MIESTFIFFYGLGCAQITSRAKDPSVVPSFPPDTSHQARNRAYGVKCLRFL